MSLRKTLAFLLLLSNSLDFVQPAADMFGIFDPHVSILDKRNPYRYSVTDLLPLVNLTATRFSRLLVILKSEDFNLNYNKRTSMSLSLMAIAHYNTKLGLNTETKLEAWIAHINENHTTTSQSQVILAKLLNISNDANEIAPNTVTTIMLIGDIFNNLNDSNLDQFAPMKFVVLSMPPICQNMSWKHSDISEFPYIVHGTFVSLNEYVTKAKKFVPACPKCKLLDGCNSKESSSTNPGFIVSISDTYYKTIANMSQQVSAWETLHAWSISANTTIFFSKVFDTPYEQKVEAKTSGWWRLAENSEYKTTNDYKFVEKSFTAKEFDFQEHQINFKSLENPRNFSRDYVGVIFSASSLKRTASSPYPAKEMAVLMLEIVRKFSKILILLDLFSSAKGLTAAFEIQSVANFCTKTEILVMARPEVPRWRSPSSKKITMVFALYNINLIAINTVTLIVPYIEEKTQGQILSFKQYFQEYKPKGYGYAFNVSLCQYMSEKEKELIQYMLNDDDVTVAVFYFEDDADTVKLGAERMFQQQIVQLEQCKRFLKEIDVFDKLSVIFLMLHYATETDFYQNPWAIQTYIRYWEKFTHWAGNTNTTLIMNNAIDGARYLNTKNKYGQRRPQFEVGWWRLEESSNQSNMWVDKRQDAIRAAKLQFAKKARPTAKSVLNSNETLLIVLILILVLTIAIVVGMSLIRKHKRNHLSKREISEFFNGGESSDYSRISYNKNLEIDCANFCLDEGGLLGTGEFGIVSKGRLVQDIGSTDVAIKRPNPLNVCKTTILGLLSEIKVLSLVEKHANIVELLGANTSDLKRGKVFIFLEFCHNGSLETYLQNLRNTLKNDITHCEQSSVDGLLGVQNNPESLHRILPKLYRWSREICNGMAHLANLGIVHRDLATRNVLLSLDEQAKICDFGLSKRINNRNNGVNLQQGPMPWKWMAPESLRSSTFNEKTDVWAYGVTLWEIYSLGDRPYPGISFYTNFAQTLQLGFQLNEPQFNERGMYRLMQSCWNINPGIRPTFALMKESFDNTYQVLV